jgi:hypothetical protein
MKTLFLLFLLLMISGFGKTQDSIFMKSGVVIPSIILDTGKVEIKFKKLENPESQAIYSVFVSDVSKIRFKDGKLVDYSLIYGNKKLGGTPFDFIMKWNFGVSQIYFQRNQDDNLLLFWRARNKNQNLTLTENPKILSIRLGMQSALGGSRRNWFGANCNLNFSQKDAIHASNYYLGSNEINLKVFEFDIFFLYAHSVNYKKNLLAVLDLGIENGSLGGNIKIKNIDYKVSGMSDMGAHLAIGMDWMITKNLNANLRFGRKFLSNKAWFNDTGDATKSFTLWVNPPSNLDLVNVNWKGNYVSFGLSFSINSKMKM